jgi:hypothetical protein
MSRVENSPAVNMITMKKDSILTNPKVKKLLYEVKHMSIARLISKVKYATEARQRRHFWQRITRGWPDSDLWSLDHSLAKLILPRLKRFKDCRGGHPSDMTDQEWDDILGEMIFGIEWYASGDCWESHDQQKAIRAHKGLELFGKYYGHLWT